MIAAKGRGSKGMGITSSVIAIVAIVMVFVTQAAYGKAIDGMSAAIEDAADGEMAAPEKVIEQAADESQVLKIGEAASIGECSVNVSAVNLDAGAVIAKANTFNDKAEGQYVLVGLSVVHKGEAEGDAWLDLSPELVGSDARIYNTTSSMAVAPKPATDVPTLTNGGKGVYQVISDVPAEAVTAAKVRVSESLSVNDEAGLWATK